MEKKSRVSIRTRNEYGSLVLIITGVVDLASFRELRHALFRGLVTGVVERVLADFSGATIDLSAADWLAIAVASTAAHALRFKGAILMPPEFGQVAWDHCQYLNQRGHIRIAFTDPPSAYQWAQVRRIPRPGQPPAGARRSKREP